MKRSPLTQGLRSRSPQYAGVLIGSSRRPSGDARDEETLFERRRGTATQVDEDSTQLVGKALVVAHDVVQQGPGGAIDQSDCSQNLESKLVHQRTLLGVAEGNDPRPERLQYGLLVLTQHRCVLRPVEQVTSVVKPVQLRTDVIERRGREVQDAFGATQVCALAGIRYPNCDVHDPPMSG